MIANSTLAMIAVPAKKALEIKLTYHHRLCRAGRAFPCKIDSRSSSFFATCCLSFLQNSGRSGAQSGESPVKFEVVDGRDRHGPPVVIVDDLEARGSVLRVWLRAVDLYVNL